MEIQWQNIDAIILDLGGVILNIDYQRTIAAFTALGYEGFDTQYTQLQQSSLFDDLETGQISPEEFVNRVQEVLPSASSDQIIEAWNALLLDFPEGRIETVRTIASRWPTFLLSNTNAIHYPAFNEILLEQTGLDDIKVLFKQAYLSHEIQLRKPDPRSFEIILDDHELRPERVLFVDDSPQHIESARKLGMQAYQLTDGDQLEDLFSAFLT